MKNIINVVVTVVMVIVTIGIVTTSVYDMTQERHVTVEPEVLLTFDIVSGTSGFNRGIDTDVKGYIDTNMDYLNENADKIYLIFYINLDENTREEVARRKTTLFAVQQPTMNRVTFINDNDVTDYFGFYNESEVYTMSRTSNGITFWGGTTPSISDTFVFIIDNSYTVPPRVNELLASLLILLPVIITGYALYIFVDKTSISSKLD